MIATAKKVRRPVAAEEGLEAEALAILQRRYRRDVAALAQRLRPRLMAGEFNGIGTSEDGLRDVRCNIDTLVDICREHPRMTSRPLALLTAFLSSPKVQNTYYGDEIDWEGHQPFEFAVFCFAREVQTYAVRTWGAPEDDAWKSCV